MVCSFSKDYSKTSFTAIENSFITDYLPHSGENAVKVYLYGLFLCSNKEKECSLSEMAQTLSLSEQEVKDCFYYWEEFGLVNVTDSVNFNVVYIPINQTTRLKPRKIKAEKYSEFAKSLQILLPSRMISTNEYTDYFSIMETYSIKPDAMLMIIKYCIDLKGNDIGHKYISTVAKDFGSRSINTIEKVEKQLADYVFKTAEISKILKALSSKRQPELEDSYLLKKWNNELNFDTDSIVFAAKHLKKGSMEKLDEFLLKLYSVKCFSKEEIENHLKNEQKIYDLTIRINKSLGIYEDVLSTEIDTYVNKWLSYGFDGDALVFIASQMYLEDKKTLPLMDDFITLLRGRGFIDLTSINDYFENKKHVEEFIKKILINAGVNRRPTPWDEENLTMWRSWNFTDDMILEAAKLSSGKSSPTAYINGILSNWKNKGIFSLENLKDKPEETQKLSQEEYNREYERRRNLAVSKAQKNTEKAMSVEGLSKLLARLKSIEKDLAFAEISDNKERLKELENEKTETQNNAQRILKEHGMCLEDLSPKYSCEKCKDTGYVASGRCDCFNLKP